MSSLDSPPSEPPSPGDSESHQSSLGSFDIAGQESFTGIVQRPPEGLSPQNLASKRPILPMPLSGSLAEGTFLGPYLLGRVLGVGGMGAVYEALHESHENVVALKAIRPDKLTDAAMARFRREMTLIKQLKHPNIVKAVDDGVYNGIHYIAMELVVGSNLQKIVMKNGPFSAAEACRIVYLTALALDAAHSMGVVHRDIKPDNLLLDAHGNVFLFDLGLALLQDNESDPHTLLTVAGDVFGTPDYMSPEQFHNSHVVDGRTDQYALGCTLYFLLVGRAPFDDGLRKAIQLMYAHLNTPHPDLKANARTNVPDEVVAIYNRLMEKNAEKRFGSTAELARLLLPLTIPANTCDTSGERDGTTGVDTKTTNFAQLQEILRKDQLGRILGMLLTPGATLAANILEAGETSHTLAQLDGTEDFEADGTGIDTITPAVTEVPAEDSISVATWSEFTEPPFFPATLKGLFDIMPAEVDLGYQNRLPYVETRGAIGFHDESGIHEQSRTGDQNEFADEVNDAPDEDSLAVVDAFGAIDAMTSSDTPQEAEYEYEGIGGDQFYDAEEVDAAREHYDNYDFDERSSVTGEYEDPVFESEARDETLIEEGREETAAKEVEEDSAENVNATLERHDQGADERHARDYQEEFDHGDSTQTTTESGIVVDLRHHDEMHRFLADNWPANESMQDLPEEAQPEKRAKHSILYDQPFDGGPTDSNIEVSVLEDSEYGDESASHDLLAVSTSLSNRDSGDEAGGDVPLDGPNISAGDEDDELDEMDVFAVDDSSFELDQSSSADVADAKDGLDNAAASKHPTTPTRWLAKAVKRWMGLPNSDLPTSGTVTPFTSTTTNDSTKNKTSIFNDEEGFEQKDQNVAQTTIRSHTSLDDAPEKPVAYAALPAVGIDLGAHYSSIAYLNDTAESVALANTEGELRTPSVVLSEDGIHIAGKEALRASAIFPDRVIRNPRRVLGKAQSWRIDGVSLNTIDVAAIILRELLRDASKRIGAIKRAAISVPDSFDDTQRLCTVAAGFAAGLRQVDIVDDSVAVSLNHVLSDGLWFNELAEEQRFVVYQLDGGSFSLSMVHYRKDSVRLLASVTEPKLGKIDWNQCLLDAVADQFTREYGTDPRSDPESLQHLLLAVEECTQSLNTRPRAALACQHAGWRKTYQVETEQFNRLTAPLLEITEGMTKQFLKENLDKGGVQVQTTILPTGVGSQMPMVSAMLRRLSGVSIAPAISSDLAIAHGAAYFSGMLLGRSSSAGGAWSEVRIADSEPDLC